MITPHAHDAHKKHTKVHVRRNYNASTRKADSRPARREASLRKIRIGRPCCACCNAEAVVAADDDCSGPAGKGAGAATALGTAIIKMIIMIIITMIIIRIIIIITIFFIFYFILFLFI
jgi:hypothetical protein